MSIPRHALIPSITPRNDRLPHGVGLWWSLHGSFAGLPDTPALTEDVVLGAASGTKWSADTWAYQFPTDNGGATNQVGLLAPHDQDDDSLEQVLGLSSAANDTQILVACYARWGNVADQAGDMWSWGKTGSTGSFFSVGLSTTEALNVNYRGVGAGTTTTLAVSSANLTLASGTATTDIGWRDTVVWVVTSLRKTGTTDGDVAVHISNGTLSAVYTGVCDFSDNSGTACPGRNASGSTTHPGFLVGYRGTTGQFWGRGAGHTARIGNVCARRYSAYQANAAADALVDLLARPHDYPESWLA